MSNINDLTFSDDESDASFDFQEPNSSIMYEEEDTFIDDSEEDEYVEEIKNNLVAKKMTQLKMEDILEDPAYVEEEDETYDFQESDESDDDEIADFEEVFDREANEHYWNKFMTLHRLPEVGQ
ncbi:hypothetical protein FT663_03725 [Candidozyma haemuli var. vulneris]|uniref:Uncharacterized protein n=1 Tax=Candidozyma haemuli TaxID=45357 RepID=A0A2V1AQI6_9ASCO|nr:hypothetical protein CXQ85_003339 [[Candida] haemuloni]KAF3988051.1 hypothetical protein FT662_03647 [[Candida] haemuloni var. vulneris]KAF3989198.1 hypothetical protein FT663_03725 [[Candida] haemuloni var. vulneris]PVH19493.1 hypothetical protein CXQ85_003339 [[Candida] haemuloni]